jgi:Fe-S oxidoreductase
MAEKIRSGDFTFPEPPAGGDGGAGRTTRVTWHDSCHIGRVSGVYDEPRELIKAVPGTEFVEMEFNHEQAHCCGSVLTLLSDPPAAHDIGKERLDEAIAAGAEKVLALCPCCEFQLRVSAEKRDVPVEVEDLSHYVAAPWATSCPTPTPRCSASGPSSRR